MSDINNNININVNSNFSSYSSLMEKLDAVKAKFGEIGEPKGVKRLTKYLEKVADPISTVNKMLDITSKKIAMTQEKISLAKIQGDSTKDLEAQLKRYENVQKAIYSFVENNPAVKNSIAQNALAEQMNQASLEKAQTALQDFERSLDPVKQKTYELNQQLEQARQEFLKLEQSGQNTDSVKRKISKLTKEMQKLEESTKKTSSQWKILLGRIKNITIYRTIRRALQIIFQTITQGFERVAKLNGQAEKSALRLKADYNLIATAVGVTVSTLLNAFIGDIDKLTDTLINYFNSFNKVLAILTNSDTYLKVVRKDIEGINKATQKLSFDKFEALNKSDESTMGVGLEEVALGTDAVDELSQSELNLYNILKSVKTILANIYETGKTLFTGVIMPILNSGVTAFFINLLASVVQFLDKIGLLKTALYALIILWTGSKLFDFTTSIISSFKALWGVLSKLPQKFQEFNLQCALAKTKSQILQATWKSLAVAGASIAVSIISLVKNWDSMSSASKGWVIAIAVLTGAVAALAFAIYAAQQRWAKAIAVAAGVVTAGTTVMTAISGFEKGGIPEKSELFYMNEYGRPEALVNTGGSQTNVINGPQLAQLVRQGFVDAIYETGLVEALQNRLVVDGNNINDNAFARAIFPALKVESTRRGGDQL